MFKDQKNIAYIKDDFLLYYKARNNVLKSIFSAVIVLMEPGFWAIFFYRISRFFYCINFYLIALFVMRLNKFLTHVDISFEATIGRNLRLPHCFDIVIGSTAEIADNVEILNGVTLGAKLIRSEGKRHPTINSGVIIGSGAKILGNVIIGENSIVGANTVVLEDVPSNVTAVGIPAKILKSNCNTIN